MSRIGEVLSRRVQNRVLVIDRDMTIECSEVFDIGARPIFGYRCTLATYENLVIGEDYLIAKMVSIPDHDHTFARTAISAYAIAVGALTCGNEIRGNEIRGNEIRGNALQASSSVKKQSREDRIREDRIREDRVLDVREIAATAKGLA